METLVQDNITIEEFKSFISGLDVSIIQEEFESYHTDEPNFNNSIDFERGNYVLQFNTIVNTSYYNEEIHIDHIDISDIEFFKDGYEIELSEEMCELLFIEVSNQINRFI